MLFRNFAFELKDEMQCEIAQKVSESVWIGGIFDSRIVVSIECDKELDSVMG